MNADEPEEPAIDTTDSYFFRVSERAFLKNIGWLYGAPMAVFFWLLAKAPRTGPHRGEVEATEREIAIGIQKSLFTAQAGLSTLKAHGWLVRLSSATARGQKTVWKIRKFKGRGSFVRAESTDLPASQTDLPASQTDLPASQTDLPASQPIGNEPASYQDDPGRSRTIQEEDPAATAPPSSPDALAPSSSPPPKKEFIDLMARYPEGESRGTVQQALKDFERTRRNGRMSAGLVLAFLRWCAAYPVDQVLGGLEVYLDKDCAGDGKAERYAQGIIRNWKPNGGNGRVRSKTAQGSASGRSSGWVQYADNGELTEQQQRDNLAVLRSLKSEADEGEAGQLLELPEAVRGA
ncbi:MAG: hypothetical protein HY816_20135 [Candidatus Wallbacteria bacterium]|nr:hypothetical protein [Candidatus Wallbacteria bacterium]